MNLANIDMTTKVLGRGGRVQKNRRGMLREIEDRSSALLDGRKYCHSVSFDQPNGGGNPLSREELTERYRAMTKGFLSSLQIDRSIELISNLENLDNIAELMKLTTFGMSN